MEVWCPYCNEKANIDNDDAYEHANDWYEDVTCDACGGTYDLFIELEPVAVPYVQRKKKCAGCGEQTKLIKLRRNPYALSDGKRYCEECFNKNIERWIQKFKEEAEANKPVKRGRKPKKDGKTK